MLAQTITAIRTVAALLCSVYRYLGTLRGTLMPYRCLGPFGCRLSCKSKDWVKRTTMEPMSRQWLSWLGGVGMCCFAVGIQHTGIGLRVWF